LKVCGSKQCFYYLEEFRQILDQRRFSRKRPKFSERVA
jgi:hypothetical protein